MSGELLRWLISFLCGGAVSFVGTYLRYRRRSERAIKEGLQALLRAEIIRQYEKHIERGYCPLYAKEALKREYHSYHELGGNDVATELYHEVLTLPTELQDEHIEYR